MNKISQSELEHLLAKIALKDRNAFKQLYNLYAGVINGIAYRIVGNKEVANEVTQEVFIQIWNNSAEYSPAKAQANTWMSAIARYRAYDVVRRHASRIEGKVSPLNTVEVDSVSNPIPDVANLLANKDALNKCLHALEQEQRDAIVMAYYYGFSRDELAAHFKRTVNTIKSILRRGIARLQVCLYE